MFRAAFLRIASYAIVLSLVAGTATAASIQHKIAGELLADLERVEKTHSRVRIEGIPLVNDRAETLVLEEFDVMAPGAKIRFHREDGRVVDLEPTPMRQYRGHVEGEAESLVYLSVSQAKVEGVVFVRDRKFMVSSRRAKGAVSQRIAIEGDVFIEEVPAEEEFGQGRFECAVEGESLRAVTDMVPRSLATGSGPKPLGVSTTAAPSGTQSTVLNLVLQGDSQLYTNFGSNAASVETFIRNLAGAASTIYQRDLATILRIVHLDVFSTTDPWSVVLGANSTWNGQSVKLSTTHALLEYGDYWNNTPPTNVKKSAAMIISGMYESQNGSYSFGGVAWRDLLCANPGLMTAQQGYSNPYVGHYYGSYGFCGGNGVFAADRTVPNPDADPDYGAPSSGYWPLLQFAHELGHIVESKHTHCVDTDSVTTGLQPVDNCFNGEPGCFGGSPSLPAVGGTIMSYCHFNYGGAATRFTFGQVGELSSAIRTNMRTRLGVKTPTLSAITAPASVASGAASNASVTLVGGMTYDWTITNGVINSGQATNAITFTATADPVTLRATATNSLGCAISDYRVITVTAGCSQPPSISGQPLSSTITSGQTASLSVTASSPGTITYQWYRGAVGTTSNPVSGATAATLNIAPTVTTSYWVRATNSCGFTNSAGATITVNSPCSSPTISTQPASVSIFAGQSATLRVIASSATALSYQWYRGASGTTTTPLNAATLSTLKVTLNATTSYWVRVTNACGFVNSSTATVTVKPIPATPRHTEKTTDFNADGRSDIFWRYAPTGSHALWLMNGATRTGATVSALSGDWKPVALGDFNLDGKGDIFWHNSTTGQTRVWLMNGGVILTNTALSTVGDLNEVVEGSGDFNGDGRPDLFWRNRSTGANTIWFMNGTVATPQATVALATQAWMPVAFGDFNGDGRDDVFWRHNVTGATSVWTMNGVARTVAASTPMSDLNWYPRGTADFNGDGRTDILLRNDTTGGNIIWLMNGAIRTHTSVSAYSNVWRPVAFGDFDGDGRGDIFWWHTSTGATRVWLMNGGTIVTNAASSSLTNLSWDVAPAK